MFFVLCMVSKRCLCGFWSHLHGAQVPLRKDHFLKGVSSWAPQPHWRIEVPWAGASLPLKPWQALCHTGPGWGPTAHQGPVWRPPTPTGLGWPSWPYTCLAVDPELSDIFRSCEAILMDSLGHTSAPFRSHNLATDHIFLRVKECLLLRAKDSG